ncbi:MAG: hypothetical protein ISR76_06780 [Planctomycetes bacterium]|nr:hypothetical protein [Planctomycetota bacterium]
MSRPSSVRIAAALTALALLPACVSFNFQQRRVYQPPALELLPRLEEGRSSLREALDLLGAPSLVAAEGEGAVLTWLWDDADARGLNASVRLGGTGSVSFNWLDSETFAHRLQLRFDPDWRLVQILEENP